MADKYLIQGATYCGDGTTSAEAASNGAAGAWNNINVFEGSAPAYGSLAAGDTVYIRSKTSAGADITRTLAANATLGSASATSSNFITWILDGGTKWSGINGTLTYECPSSYGVTLRSYNYYRSESAQKLIIKETNTAGNKYLVTFPGSCQLDGALIDASLSTNSDNDTIVFSGANIAVRNIYAKWGKHAGAGVFRIDAQSNVKFYNTTVELLVLETGRPVFQLGSSGACARVVGGTVFGAGATTYAALVSQYYDSGLFVSSGMDMPREMATMMNSPNPVVNQVHIFGLDGGSGAVLIESWGQADSLSTGNYPTLDAYLPTSTAKPWSWKIYPDTAGPSNPFALIVPKLFTGTAATKTFTANLLVSDAITLANKNTVWIDVSYVDNTTGLRVTVSSQSLAAGALDTSTASWSATTYGAVSLLKRKLSITTPTAIKQDTLVNVTIGGTLKATASNHIMFFDPDVSIS